MITENQFFKGRLFSILSIVFGLLFVLSYFFNSLAYKNIVENYIDPATFKVNGIHLVFTIISFVFYKIAKEKDNADIVKKISYWFQPFPWFLFFFFFIAIAFPGILSFGFYTSIFLTLIWTGFILQRKKIPYQRYIGIDEEDDNITEHQAGPGDFVIGEIYRRNLNEDGFTPPGEDDYIESGKKAVLPLRDRFVHVLALGVTGSGKTSQSLLPMFLQDFLSDNFKFANIDVVQMGQIVLEPKGDFAKTTWSFGKIKEEEKRISYISFLLDVPAKIKNKISEVHSSLEEYISKEKGEELSKSENKELEKLQETISNKEKMNGFSEFEKRETIQRYKFLSGKASGKPLSKEELEHKKLTESNLKKLIYVQRHISDYLTFDFLTLDENFSTYALFRYASLLTDIISNPSESENSWSELVNQDPKQERDVVLLFDPSSKDSPYFNPLFGPEDTAVSTVTTTIISFMSDSAEYFKNTAKDLLQKAIRVAKRVHGDDATLLHINDLLTNNGSRGDQMLKELGMLDTGSSDKSLENKDFQSYFMNNYYSGLKGLKNGSGLYENTSGVRSILANLLDSKRIQNVLCPPPGRGSDIDFDKILKTGDKVALSTATGLSDEIGRMLGSFLILQLQEAIFRRPGSENTRTPVILYIDEFQDYASSSFEGVLTKGRSYVVSATMATQTLGIVGERAGDGLVQNLQSNARNVIVYPGASATDAQYFVDRFGTKEETTINRSVSKEVDKFSFEKIRTEMGLSDERESISERVQSVERFTKDQIMYGPNSRTRGIGGNDAFGYIYYIIVVKNSPQIPAVAKISYIPRDLKEESDKRVAAYDDNHRLKIGDEKESIEAPANTTIDPFLGEGEFIETEISVNVDSKESDPMILARGLDNKILNQATPSELTTEPVFSDNVAGIELNDEIIIPDDSDIPIDFNDINIEL